MLYQVTCPHCHSSQVILWSSSPQFNKCTDCSLIFQDTIPSQKELEVFYSNYHSHIHQSQDVLNSKRLISYDIDIEFLFASLKQHGLDPSSLNSVFDYGASGGYFLDRFPDHFTTKRGWDFGDEAAQTLQLKGYYQDIDSNQSEFDLLIFRGVLEHMRDPWTELSHIINRIRPRYILFTATPNGSSIAASIFRDKWHMHLPTEHIYHFSPHHIVQLMHPLDYHLLNLDYLYLNTPYADYSADSSNISAALSSQDFQSSPYFDSMINCLFRLR